MNEIMRRTEQLRAQMKAHGVDAYIVPDHLIFTKQNMFVIISRQGHI